MNESNSQASDAVTISVERMIWFCYLVKMEYEYVRIPRRVTVIPENLTRWGMMIFMTASFLYSLFDTDKNSIHLGKIWKGFDHPFDSPLQAIENRLIPFKDDLRLVRNSIGFHGSRNRNHEKRGLDIFNVETPRAREFAEIVRDMAGLAQEMIKWYTDQMHESLRPRELWQDFLIELQSP